MELPVASEQESQRVDSAVPTTSGVIQLKGDIGMRDMNERTVSPVLLVWMMLDRGWMNPLLMKGMLVRRRALVTLGLPKSGPAVVSKFMCFREQWKAKKVNCENWRQWWEMGKAQVRIYTVQYTANSSTIARLDVQALEREICSLELGLTATLDSVLLGKLQQKRKELGVYLNERAKGALV
ncbi:hypothetical protein AOLI_G00054530 [Acnodon oligacanthus]